MTRQGPFSGQIIGNNKYELGDLLGNGGFGVVYKARHLHLQRQQAIKILLEHHFHKSEFRDRFLREAQTVAALDHPNIIHTDDFWIEPSRAYLTMPFIGGGTLHDILQKQPFLELEQIVLYLEDTCAALEYAHKQQVVHLDLKPLNLLVHDDGRLLLADFGLAHMMKQGAIEGGSSLNFGTPHYMAPEHIQGHPERRSDLFSLGIILYQMLVGQRPFEGLAPEMVMIKNLKDWPRPPRALRPELPQALEEMVGKAIAKQPEQRYQDASEFLAAFKKAITSPTILVTNPIIKMGLSKQLIDIQDNVHKVALSQNLSIEMRPGQLDKNPKNVDKPVIQQNSPAYQSDITLPYVAYLQVEKGKEPGRIYEIRKKTFTIGRNSDSDIFLEDGFVERFHASITQLEKSQYGFKHEGKIYKSKINGQLVNSHQVYLLHDGDLIQLGKHMLSFAGIKNDRAVSLLQELMGYPARDRHIQYPSNIAYIRIVGGKEPGRIYEIRKEIFTIGRDHQRDMYLDDLSLSRLHASITNLGNDNYNFRDEGSANGCKINGYEVGKNVAWPLYEGAHIQLGRHTMLFFLGEFR